jgi:starch synthase
LTSGLKVLYATPEIAPWIKTGGLGDVSGALPAALKAKGIDVRVLVPAYPALRDAFPEARKLVDIASPGGQLPPSQLMAAEMPDGTPLLLLDAPTLYSRPGGPYQSPQGSDWPDNHLRFALLSYAACLLARPSTPLSWRPDVLHCNDWQTAMAPAYLHYLEGAGRAATVQTIHNLAFQGLFAADVVTKIALPAAAFVFDGVEFFGQLSFLKAGLQFADRITTVSPTYAREIQGSTLGFGLDALVRHRHEDLSGILNGIGEQWNPASDPHIVATYDRNHLSGKLANRVALQRELRLAERSDLPVMALISRLTHQKGLDLLLDIASDLLAAPVQLVVLGQGDAGYEQQLLALAADHPERVAVTIGFSDALAHRIEAGADIFLMPSRFEPCGLNQMYSLRYGTPPVARATGGLADTVINFTLEALHAGTANGFTFQAATPAAFLAAARRAIAAWHDRKLWQRLQKIGMACDFSWGNAASDYVHVYRAALKRRHG